jgi:predicted NBD/HSP70 family sugar kinase
VPENRDMVGRQTVGPWLVYDIGGTNLRAGVYEPTRGRLSKVVRRSTRPSDEEHRRGADPVDTLLSELNGMADELLGDTSPAVVSVAFPGPIDAVGRVLAAPTLWGSTTSCPYPLLSDLATLWPSSRIALLNDVTAAGYRYLTRELSDFCIVTVSSGIGHKVFVRGHPIVGRSGLGGEMGHLLMDASPDAAPCDCGGHGHLAALSSGRGVLRRARALAEAGDKRFATSSLGAGGEAAAPITNERLAAAFRSADRWCRELIAESTAPLGRMLATVHALLGIDHFILVGGFALALGEDYRRQVADAAAAGAWEFGPDWNQMVHLGEADDLSGLIGAGVAVESRVPAVPASEVRV